jgi:glycosyltransferase involved in cell wall biosynthesis
MYPSRADPASGVFVEQQVRSLQALGVEVDVLHLDRTGLGPRAYVGLPAKLRHAIERTRPTVVDVAYGGVMAARVTEAVRNRPVIVHYRGSDLLGSPAEPLLRRMAISVGVRASLRAAARAAAIIVMSEAMRAAIPPGVAGRKVTVLPDGIDLERFKPLNRDTSRAQLGWTEGGLHVLFPAAPNRPEKRYGLAAAAVEATRAARPAVELHTLGRVPHAEVPVWINASDVVLLTSTHEGSANAVKEALACNVPVVTVDAGDARQRIADVPGCYIAEATEADLADKLQLVMATGGRVAGRAAVASLALDRTAERLAAIYEAVARPRLSGG